MRLMLALLLLLLPALAGARGLTAHDLAALRRMAEIAPSPDGRQIVYTLSETDFAANQRRNALWLEDRKGTTPQRLTPADSSASSAHWSADGKRIYFLSNRSGSSQIWVMQADGSNARQVSNYAQDIGGFMLAERGARILFWADAFPDCVSLICTRDRLAATAKSPETGQLHDRLFVRHWDRWADGRRSILFSAPLGSDGRLAAERGDAMVPGAPVALSAALDGDVPSKPLGDGNEITVSPDGNTVYFALRQAGRSEAWSTNLDIFAAPVDGSARPRNLTEDLKGQDSDPRVSPDGRTLAWLSMARPGFEADKRRLMLQDLASGKRRDLTANWDRSISAFEFAPDGKSILAIAQHLGTTPLWRIALADGKVTQLTQGGAIGELAVGKGVFVTRHDLGRASDLQELWNGRLKPLTRVNADLLAGVEMGRASQFSFKGWHDETVYGWLIEPVGAAPGVKVPTAFIVHGGPQGSFGDQWHYRWNPQVYAARGFAVVMIDFHGSTGYGQAFTDSISQDWGGKPLEDLKKGWTAALARFPLLDEDKVCALGGSYGGYMMNWIASQWPDEFRCLVNHAGIFDTRAFATTTEELWFPEWEFGGRADEEAAAERLEQANPARFADRWRTPMLVIHGQKDFRVPYSQGLASFTALQRRGIDSQLLLFPDENHWIMRPANIIQWHDVVLDWLERWLKSPKSAPETRH